MSRRVTIQDVAREAGVSKVTVSYVLNGRGMEARISPSTSTRILDTAKQMGYRPNALARMLVTRRTETLAVVLQSGAYFSAWSGFTSEVMRGISEACFAEGYDLMLHTKQVHAGEDEADALADGRVDGALVLRDADDPTLARLVERGLPCVQFFTHTNELCVPYVDCENVVGSELATEHLIDLGHTRIGMIHGSLMSVSSRDRVEGFGKALDRHGIPVRQDWVLQGPDIKEFPHQVVKAFIDEDRPTALVVWSDDVAITVMKGLREIGLRIPEDVSIVGFDSLAAAESAVPPLTSIRQPVGQMAAEATRMLIALAKGESLDRQNVLFEPILDVRASTSSPKVCN